MIRYQGHIFDVINASQYPFNIITFDEKTYDYCFLISDLDSFIRVIDGRDFSRILKADRRNLDLSFANAFNVRYDDWIQDMFIKDKNIYTKRQVLGVDHIDKKLGLCRLDMSLGITFTFEVSVSNGYFYAKHKLTEDGKRESWCGVDNPLKICEATPLLISLSDNDIEFRRTLIRLISLIAVQRNGACYEDKCVITYGSNQIKLVALKSFEVTLYDV